MKMKGYSIGTKFLVSNLVDYHIGPNCSKEVKEEARKYNVSSRRH